MTRASTEAVAAQLHLAAVQLLRRLKRADASAGISAARLSTLSLLVRSGPQSLSELARAEQVRAPTITAIVRALEADGLVAKKGAKGDRRVSFVRATAKGRKFVERGARAREKALRSLLDGLTASEIEAIGQAARIISGD